MSSIGKTSKVLFTLLWLLTVTLVVVWDQNTLSISASGLGVAATLLLLFGLRWWRGVATVGSVLFVANWALAFIAKESGGLALETYWHGLREAARSGSALHTAVVLGYEAALPALHLVAAAMLIVSMLKHRATE